MCRSATSMRSNASSAAILQKMVTGRVKHIAKGVTQTAAVITAGQLSKTSGDAWLVFTKTLRKKH